MSYLVLARKLRPTRFCDLIGQESIWKTLINAIATNRVAHAFLFTGPRGTGKTSSARILTKALNCLSPVDYEPCNECENCVEINRGISADVMEIDAASNRGIEHIRELREGVKFSPAKCKYKTYIIDEVHMLTTESFNALLKTLEEPPSHVKFILATTDHHKVPSTVISRCQRFDFSNISTPVMCEYLRQVANNESIQLSDTAIDLIAKSSSGGVRDALTILDMLISFGGNEIDDAKVTELLGINDAREVDTLLRHVIEKNLEEALLLFQNLVKKGRSLAQLITDLMKAVKDLSLVVNLPGNQIQWREFLPDQLELYQFLSGKITAGTLQQYFQILLEIESQIKRSSQANICVEMGLIRMCSVESLAGIAEVISVLRSGKQQNQRQSMSRQIQSRLPGGQQQQQPVGQVPAPPNQTQRQPVPQTPPVQSAPAVSQRPPEPVASGAQPVSQPMWPPQPTPIQQRPPVQSAPASSQHQGGPTQSGPTPSELPAQPVAQAAPIEQPAQPRSGPAPSELPAQPVAQAAPTEQPAQSKPEPVEAEPQVREELAKPTPKPEVVTQERSSESPVQQEKPDSIGDNEVKSEIDGRPVFDYSQLEEPPIGNDPGFVAMDSPPPFPDDMPLPPEPGSEPFIKQEKKENQKANILSDGEKSEEKGIDTIAKIPENNIEASSEESFARWEAFVEYTTQTLPKALLSRLRTAKLLGFDSQRIVLGVQSLQYFNEERKHSIETAAQEFFKSPVQVLFQQEEEAEADGTIKGKEDAAREQKILELKEAAKEDPRVLEIQQIFPNSSIHDITLMKEPKND